MLGVYQVSWAFYWKAQNATEKSALHSQLHHFPGSIPPEELFPLERVRDGKTNIILNGIFLHYYHSASLNSPLKPTARTVPLPVPGRLSEDTQCYKDTWKNSSLWPVSIAIIDLGEGLMHIGRQFLGYKWRVDDRAFLDCSSSKWSELHSCRKGYTGDSSASLCSKCLIHTKSQLSEEKVFCI